MPQSPAEFLRGSSPTRPRPELSVVVPVFNEEDSLPALFPRLYGALDRLETSYECVFVDDGSRDRSAAMLRTQQQARPAETRVVLFQRNFGQHAAILAGFELALGRTIVTIDADLQNPPEEIARLLSEVRAGHDYVGTIRRRRKDHWARRWMSRAMNAFRHRTTQIRITDQGCMLRAYSRAVVEAVNATQEINTFIPALAYLYARHPTEIEVAHESRHAGDSKYSLYRLIRLNFDLVTGFTAVPLQLYSMLGIGVSALAGLFVVYLAVRRLVIGPEVQGVFTLFGILFFLVGLALFGIGLLGEYVGRIYEQVRGRPRYLIAAVLDETGASRTDGVRESDQRPVHAPSGV